ncbi:MAG: Lrp/AsnC family transcriptional regulator [Candidatus Hermodarchaeota archaeon]
MKDTIRAYVLMEIEIGNTDRVVEELKSINEATRVAVTTGVYDIVVLLEVESLEALYEITVNRIHKIPGIRDTSTAVIEKMIG